MKTNTVIILLSLALVANASWFSNMANSSWFAQIVNNTRLRGKVDLNTDNGMKFDYNGNLGYENGKLALNLANLGAKFHAIRKNSSNVSDDGNYSRAYDYTGALAVDQNGHHANVTVDGAVQVNGTYNRSTQDGINVTYYTFSSDNKNQYNATANNFQVQGGHLGLFKVKGAVAQNGSEIETKHKLKGVGVLCGNVTANGKNIGGGYVAKGGKAKVDQKIHLLNDDTAANINLEGHHGNPNVVGGGKAEYKGFTKFAWNNNSQAYVKAGKAEFEGLAWTKSKNDDDNSTFNGYAAAKNVDFEHKGQIYTNGKKVADYLTVGDLAIIKEAGVKAYQNGTWEKGVGSTGALNKWTIGKLAHEKNESSNSTVESSDESGDSRIDCVLRKLRGESTEGCEKQKVQKDHHHHHHDHHHKGEFLAKFKTNWAHKTYANGTVSDHNSSIIDFVSGTGYKYGGSDTLSKKPYGGKGYRVVSGNYQVTAGKPGDISIKIN